MTAQPQASISELLQASRDDQATLQFPIPDVPFGFHVQQAIEKLLKALIVANGFEFKYTHDLEELLDRTAELGERVPVQAFVPAELSRFAGIWRYQAPNPFGPDERTRMLDAIQVLQTYVLMRIEAHGFKAA